MPSQWRYDHPEYKHAERTADHHIRVWQHQSWAQLPGVGIVCTEPGCGWQMAETVIEARVAGHRNLREFR